jgi:AbrB family looped-hinge helix DNA binding protein
MTEKKAVYKTRVRARGQVTLPRKMRELLQVSEGDDLIFYANKEGQLVVQPAPSIDPEQAWFWTERWQKMEREADEDFAAGRYKDYDNVEDLIADLEASWHRAHPKKK